LPANLTAIGCAITKFRFVELVLGSRIITDITAPFPSRIQFAFTITFHIIFLSFTIGLAAEALFAWPDVENRIMARHAVGPARSDKRSNPWQVPPRFVTTIKMLCSE
jgi:hypothetical protein